MDPIDDPPYNQMQDKDEEKDHDEHSQTSTAEHETPQLATELPTQPIATETTDPDIEVSKSPPPPDLKASAELVHDTYTDIDLTSSPPQEKDREPIRNYVANSTPVIASAAPPPTPAVVNTAAAAGNTAAVDIDGGAEDPKAYLNLFQK